jgi:hypothetical protein
VNLTMVNLRAGAAWPIHRLPNPRMQPTGGSGAGLRSGRSSVSALWNLGLCGHQHVSLQLMRQSLGGCPGLVLFDTL